VKSQFSTVGIERICGLFGKTRQAWYEETWEAPRLMTENAIVLDLIAMFRRQMPRIGTRKLFYLLAGPLKIHNIKMGRDKLFKLMNNHGLLLKRRRRSTKTTYSQHWLRKYPNLIRFKKVTAAEMIWVSDITYIRVGKGFSYLSIITDLYSKKIIGYYLNRSLNAEGCLEALRMALINRQGKPYGLIHHSDRGTQYCSKEYTELLTQNGIDISMTENGDPYENAVAERVNGILKTEFSIDIIYKSYYQASKSIDDIIRIYNDVRPHASCDYLTPAEAHQKEGELNKRWKNYHVSI
jgi:putative transposase